MKSDLSSSPVNQSIWKTHSRRMNGSEWGCIFHMWRDLTQAINAFVSYTVNSASLKQRENILYKARCSWRWQCLCRDITNAWWFCMIVYLNGNIFLFFKSPFNFLSPKQTTWNLQSFNQTLLTHLRWSMQYNTSHSHQIDSSSFQLFKAVFLHVCE